MNVYITSACLIFCYMSGLFLLALYKEDNSIVDIGWGIGFILIALYSLIANGLYLPRHLLVTALTIVWGMRISLHIGMRHKGEDQRYANWRKAWGKWVILRSFFQVFMLQGTVLLIIAYPIIFINSSKLGGLTLLDILGTSIWVVGFIFETVGDYQLEQFLKESRNKGRIMRSGLWRYTRHPNYFGEALMWWGIFVIACSLPFGWTTVASPLLISFLLRYVSGVPMLEELFVHNLEYQRYKEATSVFFPWFPFTEEDIA